MTRMGLGTAQLGDLFTPLDQADANAIVEAALEHGIRHFDTAPHYGLGLAEERLGIALDGHDRDDVVISTKVGRIIEGTGTGARRRWDFTREGVEESLSSSLHRLGSERVDIAFIHDPDEHVDDAMTHAVPALMRMRDQGDVGAVGVATRDVAALTRFVEEVDIDVVMIAGRLTLLDHTALRELVPACEARGVSVMNAGVFNSGVLATDAPDARGHFEYQAPSVEILRRARQLADAAGRHGYTLPEAAVAFAMRPAPPVVSVVIGAETPAQVSRNAALFDAHGDVDGLIEEVLEMA